jgi:DNA polymerase-3 subunit alpha
MAACINNFGGFYRTEFYVHEARRVGATVVEPSIARGEWEATVHGTTLVLGFNLVAGADAATVRRAVRTREADGPFRSLEDFVRRVPVGPEQLLPLVRSGGFAFTGRSKQQLLWEAHLLLGHVRGRGGAPTLFAATARPFTLPPLEGGTLEDAFDQLELLGFPLAPPFHLLTAEARSAVGRGVPAGELAAWVGRDVEVIGYVVALKDTATVRGERMCFGCFIDAAGDWLDTVHFPPVLRSHPFRGRGIYRIRGTVREEFDCLHVEASVLEKLPYIPDPRFDDSGTPDPTAQPRPTVPRRRSAPNGRSATASWKRERPGT